MIDNIIRRLEDLLPSDPAPANLFKQGLYALCDDDQKSLITDRTHAYKIFSSYIDADRDAQLDCTKMLLGDLQEFKTQPNAQTASQGGGDE